MTRRKIARKALGVFTLLLLFFLVFLVAAQGIGYAAAAGLVLGSVTFTALLYLTVWLLIGD